MKKVNSNVAPQFDWYQATFHDCGVADLVTVLCSVEDSLSTRPIKGINFYKHGLSIERPDGHQIATLFYGGQNGINVKATSYNAIAVSNALRSSGYPHRITRMDSCVDWIEPGLFDRLQKKLSAFAVRNNIAIRQDGDWVRNQGRTLYLGGASSPVWLVLYEKGFEQGHGDPDWVRLEIKTKPDDKDKGYECSAWTPSEAMTPAPWVKRALKVIQYADIRDKCVNVPAAPVGFERAFDAMARQYWRVLVQLAAREGEADLDWGYAGVRIQEKLLEHGRLSLDMDDDAA